MSDDMTEEAAQDDQATVEGTPDSNAADETDSPFENAAASAKNLDVILNIPVRLSMEVGSTQLSIRRLLQLNRGSVVELNRLAGEPLEVFVNGTLIAHGEVVVVSDKFGIRLTDVMSPEKRIESLN